MMHLSEFSPSRSPASLRSSQDCTVTGADQRHNKEEMIKETPFFQVNFLIWCPGLIFDICPGLILL